MSDLPIWLQQLKRTLPQWVVRMVHPDGPGRYRFAEEAFLPYDLDSSTLMLNVVRTLNLPLEQAQSQGWAEYILDHQRPQDGLLIDPGLESRIVSESDPPTETEIASIRRMITRNGLNTAIHLGGRPRHRLAHEEAFETPEEMVTYLEGLHWHNPWGAGSWSGAVIVFQHFNQLLGDGAAEEIIEAGVQWLTDRQDPETGAWHDHESEISLHCLVNGIFKVWIQLLPITDLPVQFPETVVDLCLRAMYEDPILAGTPDACSIFDVGFVLDVALRFTDHRREEVRDWCAAALPMFEQFVRPDGALSYHSSGSSIIHGGLSLAPTKDQSEAAGTALHVHGIALLCNLCGLRPALGWTPVTEWLCGLPPVAES